MSKPYRKCSEVLSRYIDQLYYRAIAFAVAPSVVGVFILILWYFTRAGLLEDAGLFTIFAGLISILIASIYLIVSLLWEYQIKTSSKVLYRRGLLCAAIIIVNFPAAYVCIAIATNLMNQHTLTIENNSASVIDRLILTAPGLNKVIKQISPRKNKTLRFNFAGEGVLEFKAKQNDVEFGGVIKDVSYGIPAKTILTIKNSGIYEVNNVWNLKAHIDD